MTLQIKLSRPQKKKNIIENKASNFTYLVIDIIKKKKKSTTYKRRDREKKLYTSCKLFNIFLLISPTTPRYDQHADQACPSSHTVFQSFLFTVSISVYLCQRLFELLPDVEGCGELCLW